MFCRFKNYAQSPLKTALLQEVFMGRPSMTEEQIDQMRIRLIQATREMMNENGIESVSIRNLGQRLGINSASVYRYFADIDELITFACMTCLEAYVDELIDLEIPAELADRTYNMEFYLKCWEIFCNHAFRNPEYFNILFFSRHSDELDRIIEQYYRLFPRDLNKFKDNQQEMLTRSDVHNRNAKILEPIIEETNARRISGQSDKPVISKSAADMINDMTVSYFYALLIEMMGDDQILAEKQTERLMQANWYWMTQLL